MRGRIGSKGLLPMQPPDVALLNHLPGGSHLEAVVPFFNGDVGVRAESGAAIAPV